MSCFLGVHAVQPVAAFRASPLAFILVRSWPAVCVNSSRVDGIRFSSGVPCNGLHRGQPSRSNCCSSHYMLLVIFVTSNNLRKVHTKATIIAFDVSKRLALPGTLNTSLIQMDCSLGYVAS